MAETRLVKFRELLSPAFSQIETKDNDTLYFLSDTGQLFKGRREYCASDSAPGTLTLMGTLTQDDTGAYTAPATFSKGSIYMLPYDGTLDGMAVEGGDLALAILDDDEEPTQGARGSKFIIIKAGSNINEAAEWQTE